MRWSILRTLVYKELLRHLANRGGLALMALLVVCALVLSLFGGTPGLGGTLSPAVQRCYVDYAAAEPVVEHLRQSIPDVLQGRIEFRRMHDVPVDSAGVIVYPQSACAIQLRPLADAPDGFMVWLWHAGEDGAALAPYEAWFWKETLTYYHGTKAPVPDIVSRQTQLEGATKDVRSGLASSLVLFGLFFVCVYLLPSLTCEERERGVLLAQVLSAATIAEILAAKYLFYLVASLAIGGVLAALYRPAVVLVPYFWLALVAVVTGSMGVGLVIASLARTQRAASMGALSYLLVITLFLTLCQQCQIAGLPYVALEYHAPRMIHAALAGSPQVSDWGHVAGSTLLAAIWTWAAAYLFRRYGWQ